jgi:prepilin-type N-terminal cleavage/methylation domain-containing protein/prepilin-type processing-associated H-X9-DG protein
MDESRLTMLLRRRRAFTLIELLVVIAIIALLLAVIVPALRQSHLQARKVVCMSNLRNTGLAIRTYANDFNDTIPFGPEKRPFTATNFYTAKGNVTSLLSLQGDGAPVGLGLLLQTYLQEQSKILFCPGADQPSNADAQLALVGKDQAQSNYFYRHASIAVLFPTPNMTFDYRIRFSNLGKNRNGRNISALVTDVQFSTHASLGTFSVATQTSHRRKTSNILFADGQVASQNNSDDRFTVNVGAAPHDALEKILQMFERADELH